MKKIRIDSEAIRKVLLSTDSSYLATAENDFHILATKANNFEDQLSKKLSSEDRILLEDIISNWMLAFHNEKIIALARGREIGVNDTIRFFQKNK